MPHFSHPALERRSGALQVSHEIGQARRWPDAACASTCAQRCRAAASRRRGPAGERRCAAVARRHTAGCPFRRQSAQPFKTRIVAGRTWQLFPGSCGKSPVLVPVGSSRRQWCPCRPARACEEACEACVDMLGRGSGSVGIGACGETPSQTLAITANDRRGPRIAANRSAGLE